MTGTGRGGGGLPPRILLAHGLLAELYLACRIDYMVSQATWLRARGAEVAVVPCPSSAAIAANAARIAQALLADPRPALLVAHSKGGLEALAALLDPAAESRCAGLIAFQSPFFGAPLADAIAARPGWHGAARLLARGLRIGEGAGLADLTTAARQRWMQGHGAAVAALLARLPVATIASDLAETAQGPDRRYLPTARWIHRQGLGPNDGLVPVAAALLPGAGQLVLPGGHRGLISRGRGRDPIGALQAGLELLGMGVARVDSAGGKGAAFPPRPPYPPK
jgi:hypothetical protein